MINRAKAHQPGESYNRVHKRTRASMVAGTRGIRITLSVVNTCPPVQNCDAGYLNPTAQKASTTIGKKEWKKDGDRGEGFAHSFVAHFLGVVGAILVLIWCISFRGGLAWEATNKNLIFNLHPVLMLIGLIIIGGEAIMSYKCLPLKKPEKKLIHLVLHATALILGIIGIYMAFKFHNESNIANFTVYTLGLVLVLSFSMAFRWCFDALIFTLHLVVLSFSSHDWLEIYTALSKHGKTQSTFS
ncbi:Transmembrane ascorbate ferrireductase 1 [Sesamum angolense]|uniref:Transmembrane ascorbate ferrireductase 1 n=1 Tax=Sesamum angolense TaxID=2727404 RepID=A0AAE1TBL3_9LAMI|nr:Transmembrane ascorbate ferrireductase 1 [Sesamum angolense]